MELKKSWSQYAYYALALVISLVVQIAQPEMFAILCTPLPIVDRLKPQLQGLDLPLNSPVIPKKVID